VGTNALEKENRKKNRLEKEIDHKEKVGAQKSTMQEQRRDHPLREGQGIRRGILSGESVRGCRHIWSGPTTGGGNNTRRRVLGIFGGLPTRRALVSDPMASRTLRPLKVTVTFGGGFSIVPALGD